MSVILGLLKFLGPHSVPAARPSTRPDVWSLVIRVISVIRVVRVSRVMRVMRVIRAIRVCFRIIRCGSFRHASRRA